MGLEEQRLVDKHLIEHLVDRYSTLRHKFGFTEKHKYAHFGFEMPSLDEMRQAALRGRGTKEHGNLFCHSPKGLSGGKNGGWVWLSWDLVNR